MTEREPHKKKLIEVAQPLDAINKASAREKSIRHGHPSTLHLWWARRPLAAARAVIFSQMVDDPSGYTETLLSDSNKKRAATRELGKRKSVWDEHKTRYEEACRQCDPSVPDPGPEPTLQDCVADIERERLFHIIEDLVLWENTTNETVLQQARDEIWQSWRRACAENADHPQAKELFDRYKLPAFHDPFAGGGTLPLEAQRLGLEAYASDLNPVAVLINKAMIDIPPKFAGKPPVNPESNPQTRHSGRIEAETRNPEVTQKLDPGLSLATGLPDDKQLTNGGTGASAYADAVVVYLAFAISKVANIGSSIASWMSDRGAFRETFARQAIPMVWDFSEANPFADAGGSLSAALDKGAMAINAFPATASARAIQADASSQVLTAGKLVSTDPPYYDNISYADLSDYFYVWLRRSLRSFFPDLFATLAVPKAEELVATTYRHGSKKKADAFFLDGMTQAMQRLAEQAHPAFPITIYYAFKQSESGGDDGTASTGWETFLDAMILAGFALSGTWPMRTEGSGRIIAKDTNALASSIILVCRKRADDAKTATRREFITALKAELPVALMHLQRGNIAPVDLAPKTRVFRAWSTMASLPRKAARCVCYDQMNCPPTGTLKKTIGLQPGIW